MSFRKHYILIFAFFIPIVFWAQTNTLHNNWKKILVYHQFAITKHKKNIPLAILKKIEIDSLSELANPHQKWNVSCIISNK